MVQDYLEIEMISRKENSSIQNDINNIAIMAQKMSRMISSNIEPPRIETVIEDPLKIESKKESAGRVDEKPKWGCDYTFKHLELAFLNELQQKYLEVLQKALNSITGSTSVNKSYLEILVHIEIMIKQVLENYKEERC